MHYKQIDLGYRRFNVFYSWSDEVENYEMEGPLKLLIIACNPYTKYSPIWMDGTEGVNYLAQECECSQDTAYDLLTFFKILSTDRKIIVERPL